MQRLAAFCYRVASWRSILLAAFVYGLFLAQVMAPQGAAMRELAGDWGAPDGHFFYTPAQLYAEIGGWSSAAKEQYISFRLGLDPLWACTYAALLILVTSAALRRLLFTAHPWYPLNLLALVPAGADISENFLGIALVAMLPDRSDALAWLTAGITACKWTSLALAHLVMAVAVVAALYQALRPPGRL